MVCNDIKAHCLLQLMIQSRGRESGGDAWKQYVRWSACTSTFGSAHILKLVLSTIKVNFSDAAPLAQGVDFEPMPN